MTVKLSHIVCAAENGAIGKDGALPWHLPADFKFFKAKTMGRAMIMGRKTFDSIGKPLPGRLSLVVSRDPSYAPAGAVVLRGIGEAIAYAKERRAEWGDEIFVIGGGEIYRQTLDQADRIYLTRVHQTFDGDAFYPKVDAAQFREVEKKPGEGGVPFTWITYDRI